MIIDFGNDIYEEPIVAKTFLAEDAQESSLRPKTLTEYIGQEKAKENLAIFIQAARKREEAPERRTSALSNRCYIARRWKREKNSVSCPAT